MKRAKPSCAETAEIAMNAIRAAAPSGPDSSRSYIVLAFDADGDAGADFDGMRTHITHILKVAVAIWDQEMATEQTVGTWQKNVRN